MFGAGEIRNFSRAQFGRQREFGARHQPVGEVVALRVKDDAFRRDDLQLLFQFVHILGSSHFAPIGQTKHEVAEAELLGQDPRRSFSSVGERLRKNE